MKRITVVGGNLFALAAQHLNDATQWFRIAQLNGLSDPFGLGVSIPVQYLTDDFGNPIIADPGGLELVIDNSVPAVTPVSLIIPNPDASLAGLGVPPQ